MEKKSLSLVERFDISEMLQVVGGKDLVQSKTIYYPDGKIVIITTTIKDDGKVIVDRQEQ